MKDPQTILLLNMLLCGHSVTGLQAKEPPLNISYLPARIADVKKICQQRGYVLNEEWIKTNSGKRVKRWWLVLQPQQTTMQFEGKVTT